MQRVQMSLAHRVAIRLLVVVGTVSLALVAAWTTRSYVYADLVCVTDDSSDNACIGGDDLAIGGDDLTIGGDDLASGPAAGGTGDSGKEDGNPDCGKDPYQFNATGNHYQRQFSKWCEPYTGDPNESLYDGLFFNETPLAP